MPTDLKNVHDHPANVIGAFGLHVMNTDEDYALKVGEGLIAAGGALLVYEVAKGVTFAALDNDALAEVYDTYSALDTDATYNHTALDFFVAVRDLLGLDD